MELRFADFLILERDLGVHTRDLIVLKMQDLFFFRTNLCVLEMFQVITITAFVLRSQLLLASISHYCRRHVCSISGLMLQKLLDQRFVLIHLQSVIVEKF